MPNQRAHFKRERRMQNIAQGSSLQGRRQHQHKGAHRAKPLKLGEMLMLLLLGKPRLPANRSGTRDRATFDGADAEQSNQQRDRRGDTHGSLQLNSTKHRKRYSPQERMCAVGAAG